MVAICVVEVPGDAVGAVGMPVKAGELSAANPEATNAVVAIWVVFVPEAAVGAVGVPINAGLSARATLPPVPLVPNDVPHADPVLSGMPAPGYTVTPVLVIVMDPAPFVILTPAPAVSAESE